MEPVSDVKATVTGDAETESVDYDVTGDAETDSISSKTETESVSGEIDTESVEDMTETKSLYHINLDRESLLSTPVSDAANEVTALQAARANLATTEAALQAARVKLAAKEAANLKASAAAKAALLSNNGLYTPAGYSIAPKTVSSPLGLNLVTYPNGAIVPTEGADILAARASHQAAHDATTSGSLKADHSGVHPVADADHSAGHDDHSSQIRHDSIKLVSHPGGAVVPAEGFALATARAKHLAAHKAASAEGTTSIEADQTNNLSTEGAQQ